MKIKEQKNKRTLFNKFYILIYANKIKRCTFKFKKSKRKTPIPFSFHLGFDLYGDRFSFNALHDFLPDQAKFSTHAKYRIISLSSFCTLLLSLTHTLLDHIKKKGT